MKVRCIDNKGLGECLTLGRVYDVLGNHGSVFLLVDDRGVAANHIRVRFEIVKEKSENKPLRTIAKEIGELVQEKNQAYGNSFGKSGDFLKLLYPDGIKPEQYQDMLLVARIFDKQMRIANKKDAFGESPYKDIAGYEILGAWEGIEKMSKEQLKVSELNHRLHLNYAKKLVEEYQDSFDRDIALGHSQTLMRNHVKSLIYQAEKFQEIVDTWVGIEDNGEMDDAEDFYSIVQDILGGGNDE